MPLVRIKKDNKPGWSLNDIPYVGDDVRVTSINTELDQFTSSFLTKELDVSNNIFSLEQWETHKAYVAYVEEQIKAGWENDQWADTELIHDMLLHSSYFEALGKEGEPNQGLMTQIAEAYGSLANLIEVVLMRTTWADTDWVVIAFDYNFGRLVVNNRNTWLPNDMKILFSIDLKEHAYIIDYKFDKVAYVRHILDNINWGVVNSRFDSILRKSREKVSICKTSEEGDERYVFGWANVSINVDGEYPLDHDGQIMDPEVLEKAAYNFVLDFRDMGERHQGSSQGTLIESTMFTKEKMEVMGIPEGMVPEGWWVGFHVEDEEIFEKVKTGEYDMFSIQGTGAVIPIEEGE